MADPVLITCPADTWTLVAEGVTTGIIHRKQTDVVYLQTYRDDGELAPTTRDEGVQIFINSISEIISAAAKIDVYIYAVGKDGRVRVDLPGE